VVRRIALDFRFDLNHSAAVRYSNTGEPFEQRLFADLRGELAERFGGITACTRAPVRGVWQEIEQVVRDDLISYES
jgi:hypothetical protein